MSNDTKISDILLQYWESLKGELDMPAVEAIDKDKLEDVWDYCFLVEVTGDKYIYSYTGKSVIEAYGDVGKGDEIVDDALYPESPSLVEKLTEVRNLKEPMHYEGAFINRDNADVKFRKMLLPLGENCKVTHFLGGMRWRFF